MILVLIRFKTGVEERRSLLEVKTKPFIKDNSKFEINQYQLLTQFRAVNQIYTLTYSLEIPKLAKKMVKADKCGLTGQFMKDGGQMIKQMEEVV